MEFDVALIRKDFPALNQNIHGHPLVYFDSAATTLKPVVVPEKISAYYLTYNSNVHRGVHTLSQRATDAFEAARQTIQQFINADHSHEVIFTRGATESLNIAANGMAELLINEGDEILVSGIEHHANIVPWQQLCLRKGARLKVIPLDENGDWILDDLDDLLGGNTRIVAINHISNSLGTINPIKKLIQKAHDHGLPVIVDGAQGIVHEKVDVKDLDCDFYAFSGHKLYGPMGIGVLYGKEDWLEKIPPFQTGGSMIKDVSFERTIFADLPGKFEPGTPNVAGVVGLEAAIQYLSKIGPEKIHLHEQQLLHYATEKLLKLEGLRIIGQAKRKAGIISFVLENIHHYDAGTILDQLGIAVRTGSHCTMPLMKQYKLNGTIRASFGMYNTQSEIDYLISSLGKVNEMFA